MSTHPSTSTPVRGLSMQQQLNALHQISVVLSPSLDLEQTLAAMLQKFSMQRLLPMTGVTSWRSALISPMASTKTFSSAITTASRARIRSGAVCCG